MTFVANLAANFRGKTAIVTGAASGIGRCLSETLAAAQCLVVAIDVNEAGLIALARKFPGAIEPMPMDVSRRSVVNTFASAWGDEPAHLLVNCAGIAPKAKLPDRDFQSSWEKTIDVNVTGAMQVSRALLPALSVGRGAIVNVASIQGLVHHQNSVAYSVSKGAVIQLTRAMAVAGGELGVRVNAIAPGPTDTPMSAGLMEDASLAAAYLARTPMRRLAHPRDMLGPILFLGSEAAGHITGAILPVDGGFLSN